MTATRAEERPTPTLLDWLGVVVLVLSGLLCGLLEALLVPLYAGSVIVPIAVVLAIGSNIALPLLTRAIVPRTGIAALPFLAWLVVMIGFGSVSRPEGDVILPGGGPQHVAWVTYGTLLLGALAGAGTLMAIASAPEPRPPTPPTPPTPPPPAPPRATQRAVQRPAPSRGGAGSGRTAGKARGSGRRGGRR